MNSYASAKGKAEPDGKTYDWQLDGIRLASQHQRVFQLMKDGQWRTLAQIAQHVGRSESGVSARLRDLRKDKFGAHVVERRNVHGGLWEYRVVVRVAQ